MRGFIYTASHGLEMENNEKLWDSINYNSTILTA
jgi:hypothetical protein